MESNRIFRRWTKSTTNWSRFFWFQLCLLITRFYFLENMLSASFFPQFFSETCFLLWNTHTIDTFTPSSSEISFCTQVQWFTRLVWVQTIIELLFLFIWCFALLDGRVLLIVGFMYGAESTFPSGAQVSVFVSKRKPRRSDFSVTLPSCSFGLRG